MYQKKEKIDRECKKGVGLCFLFSILKYILFHLRTAARHRERKVRVGEKKFNHEYSVSAAGGTVGLQAPCLNSKHLYIKQRWNFLAKGYIRAPFSSYFQKNVVCGIGLGIGKLRNLILGKYLVSFTFLPSRHYRSP